ncbi:cysteine-rich receptor protein kinase [Trifolium repens]|nr:cysteine-rich receptor protein kinase [Trifolium repens]
MCLLFDTINESADKAANSSVGAKKYTTKKVSSSSFQTLYCLAICIEDLSQQDCKTCFSDDTISYLPQCCNGKQRGRVKFPSRNSCIFFIKTLLPRHHRRNSYSGYIWSLFRERRDRVSVTIEGNEG